MTSPKTLKKPAARKKKPLPKPPVRPNTRKDARTPTFAQPTISSAAKVVKPLPVPPKKVAKPLPVPPKAVKPLPVPPKKVAKPLPVPPKAVKPLPVPPQKVVKPLPVPPQVVKPLPGKPDDVVLVPVKLDDSVLAPPKLDDPVLAPSKQDDAGKVPVEPELSPVEQDALPVLADVPVQPLPKTKREGLISNSGVLRDINAGLDDGVIKELYDFYYDDDGDRNGVTRPVYGLLGIGENDYVQTPVTPEEWAKFKESSPVIEAQLMWPEEVRQYKKDLVDYRHQLMTWQLTPKKDRGAEPVKPTPPPATLEEALKAGDYFHVHNTNDLRPAKQDTKGRARRIIVNVNSQKAGLKVADSLNGLFADPVVSPYLDHYKIFLTTDTTDDAVKHDKLVVYYEMPPGAAGDKDDIGDRIAATIDGAVDDGDFVDEFAPFYSRIGRGMAWAEEPQSYVSDLVDSFTGTRAAIIDSVLKDGRNAYVEDEDAFVQLVRNAFRARFVDPGDPHRHLPGRAPRAPQINLRKEPPRPTGMTQKVKVVPQPLQPQPATTIPLTKITTRVPLTQAPVLVTTGNGPVPITRQDVT